MTGTLNFNTSLCFDLNATLLFHYVKVIRKKERKKEAEVLKVWSDNVVFVGTRGGICADITARLIQQGVVSEPGLDLLETSTTVYDSD